MEPRRQAYMVLALYAAVLTALLILVDVKVRQFDATPGEAIIVEFEETEDPPEEVPEPHADVTPATHEVKRDVESTEAVGGSDNVTQTVNSRALFRMNGSGPDQVADAGNPKVAEGAEERSSDNGNGLDSSGKLDAGLSGRGLVGSLPEPAFPPGNRGGRVVVRVSVDGDGRVISAEYEQKGSTTSDSDLVRSALAAARKARFVESEVRVQGGLITYVFTIK